VSKKIWGKIRAGTRRSIQKAVLPGWDRNLVVQTSDQQPPRTMHTTLTMHCMVRFPMCNSCAMARIAHRLPRSASTWLLQPRRRAEGPVSNLHSAIDRFRPALTHTTIALWSNSPSTPSFCNSSFLRVSRPRCLACGARGSRACCAVL